jgi:hypothetical protein
MITANPMVEESLNHGLSIAKKIPAKPEMISRFKKRADDRFICVIVFSFLIIAEQCIDLEQGDIRFDIFQSLRFDGFVFN